MSGELVEVRIAVCVTEKGWNAVGWSVDGEDNIEQAMQQAAEFAEGPTAQSVVVAMVPCPKCEEVLGEVEEGPG